ncbi:MAG TPA: lipid-A-disaccharide synthase [Nitrospirae bacterium]|nr:lipid-A-disaccharide synthase [Nitrospirota bacterium]
MMISAGEASGELYGALLSREIKKIWPDADIMGIGGSRMKKEGVRLIASTSSAIGITEVIMHLKEIIKTYRIAKNALVDQKPDVLVLIDYPDFNLTLAKKAKRAGVPILYYVSPQVWAWRAGRVKKIAALVNKMAVLFPFEVELYRDAGLACEFVGHPVAESINISSSSEELKKELGLDPAKKVIAVLPGSRPAEIKNHQSLVKDISEMIHKEFHDVQILVPLVSGTGFTIDIPSYVHVIYDRTREVVACSEAAAAASGTVTLETALLGTPMVVFYKVSAITFFLARILVSVKFASLVNLLSDREVVREYIQKNATAENIFREIKKIISDNDYRQAMKTELQKVSEIMKDKTASPRVASIVGEMAGWNPINA